MKLLNYFKKNKASDILFNVGKGFRIDICLDEDETDFGGDIWKRDTYIISADDLGLTIRANMSLKELKEKTLLLLEREALC